MINLLGGAWWVNNAHYELTYETFSNKRATHDVANAIKCIISCFAGFMSQLFCDLLFIVFIYPLHALIKVPCTCMDTRHTWARSDRQGGGKKVKKKFLRFSGGRDLSSKPLTPPPPPPRAHVWHWVSNSFTAKNYCCRSMVDFKKSRHNIETVPIQFTQTSLSETVFHFVITCYTTYFTLPTFNITRITYIF